MGEQILRQGGVLHLRELVTEIAPAASRLALRTRKAAYEFDRVIVTPSVPSFLEMVPSLPDAYRQEINRIPYQANITMVLCVDRPLMPYYWLNVTDPASPF